jgi:hypothetical protein
MRARRNTGCGHREDLQIHQYQDNACNKAESFALIHRANEPTSLADNACIWRLMMGHCGQANGLHICLCAGAYESLEVCSLCHLTSTISIVVCHQYDSESGLSSH